MVSEKQVFLEPLWNLHAYQRQMQVFPPQGYAFVTKQEAMGNKVVRATAGREEFRLLLGLTDRAIPVNLIKAWLQRWDTRPPNATLTYAVDHLVFRREPWVVEVEYANALAGTRPTHLKRFKRLIEQSLGSSNCKSIICWSEAGRRSLLCDLDSQRFADKLVVIPYAVPLKPTPDKKEGTKKVKILFVGSGSANGAFTGRGSSIFAVFDLLSPNYENLELVVRSDVPENLKARYRGIKNVSIMDKPVSAEVLEREFQTADIFLMPAYGTVPVTILHAMSYGLPVVTIDSWANREYVDHGRTGLVAERAKKVPACYADTTQPGFLTPGFNRMVSTPDPEEVASLAHQVQLLIESPELRSKLGQTARWEIERGKFSLKIMNQKLTRIFDEALSRNS